MPDEVLGPRTTITGKHELTNERSDYTIIPTPQSPTQTMSSICQSVSNDASTSSCSPPEPVTPPRQSRSKTRYGDIGRVPLHRRGKSKTYERLEDLLKEAGYKETRVFTPEAERMSKGCEAGEEDGSKDLRLTMKEGVGAVVGFLAGLMPNAAGNKVGTEIQVSIGPSPSVGLSPPPSPLAELSARKFQGQMPITPTTTVISSSLESLGNPTPRISRHQPSWESNDMPPPPIPSSSSKTASGYKPSNQWSSSQYSLATTMQKQPSRNSLNRHDQQNQRPNPNPSPMLHIAAPRPSRAGALLRHISSVPTMPGRPNSTPIDPSKATARKICLNDSDSENPAPSRANSRRRTAIASGEDGLNPPPLPATWLESVARAVLFGGTGAHIGGPADATAYTSASTLRPNTGKTPALRTTRSSLSQTTHHAAARSRSYHRTARNGLSDQTNTAGAANNALLVPPPLLFTMLERGRSGKSEGEVSHMRVVCRSAPGSRAGSKVRGSSAEAKEKQRQVRKRVKKDDKDRMPSLARTRAEGEAWERGRPVQRSQAGHSHHPSWGMYADTEDEGTGPTSSSSDEGEINLARILVPPKRQNSIRSLRKHLDPNSGRATAHTTLLNLVPGTTGVRSRNLGIQRPTSAFQRRSTEDDWDGEHHDEFGSGWVKRGAANHVSDDDDESFMGFLRDDKAGWGGSGRSRRGDGRAGLTNAWGLLPGGSGS
ncbi:hypothetical protein CVT24_007097 [Panaeolus cyanescens]|uniref:Uncharacterized protein n=1 Tax=Panaeolus cyanescens TaxID=181874 RepID=A0A409YNZ3_9AGAR|nr:hypothetical protein CVT24_007097 [Panaeolus cyanescens]